MKDLLSFLNFDPKTREGISNITVWLAILVYFLFVTIYVIPVHMPNEPENYYFYLFVLFVPAATKLIFFSGDPIAHRNNREARFFQAQFPDEYVAKKFGIDISLARHLWFAALDQRIEDGEIKRTYQYGYTCRLVYSTRRLMMTFAALSTIFLCISTVYGYVQTYHQWVGLKEIFKSFILISNLKGKLFYFMHVAVIAIYLKAVNNPDLKAPTGVWARWKHINDRNKAWVEQFNNIEAFKTFATESKA